MHPDAPPSEPGIAPDGPLWRALGWQPQSRQLEQLRQLQELLRAWNQRLNLTRLVEGEDYWIAQVFDSLWPLVPLLNASDPGVGEHAEGLSQQPPLPDPGAGRQSTGEAQIRAGTLASAASADPPLPGAGLSVIDVGTGGGFPGLAVAIALPGARLTLVDSVQRKLEAVAAMVEVLGLADRVTLRCERVERTGRETDCRGRFQLAMARAVAAAPVVAEYLVPLLAPGGQALLYRGQWSGEDQRELERTVALLNARITHCIQRDLPAGRGLRTALTVRPLAPCPATYPRPVGLPSKLPLGRPSPTEPAGQRRRRRSEK